MFGDILNEDDFESYYPAGVLENMARLGLSSIWLHAVLRDEIPAIVDCLRFFAGASRVVPASAAGEYIPGYTSMVRRDPIGVCAQTGPSAELSEPSLLE